MEYNDDALFKNEIDCKLCKNSYYPESLSGHKWIPDESLEHYKQRFSV